MSVRNKRYLSLTTLLIAAITLVTGTAFGGVAGYVVGNEIALRTQPVVQPVSNTVPFNMEQVAPTKPAQKTPMQRQHVIGEEYSTVEAVN